MNILFAAAEVAPLIKQSGLADVAGALPPALRRLGHDARIVMPRYRRVRNGAAPQQGPHGTALLPAGDRMELMQIFTTQIGDTPVYLLDIPAAFDRDAIFGERDDDRRFVLFVRGVLALMHHLQEHERWRPDVLHANDWQTGLLPNYFKQGYAHLFGSVATVYTMHNLGYQGKFNPFTLYLAGLDGGGEDFLNFMARGITFADVINTVSPTYAQEILTPEYGQGLDPLLQTRQDQLVGILNGIDYDLFNPLTDRQITAPYSIEDMSGKLLCKATLQHECGFEIDPQLPLIGMVTRLVDQKGLDLLDEALPWMLANTNAQLVALGSGDPTIEFMLARHMRQNPHRVHVQLRFDPALAQRIYSGSDIFLMPSRYEPCGLGQLIALRYGTIPLARVTGGLADTVREGYEGNGFRFHDYTARDLTQAIERCLTCFRDTNGWPILRARGMREDHSWDSAAHEYVALYEWAGRTIEL